MADPARTRSNYDPDGLALVKATCLDLASYLDDYWDDLVVVGGYVPSLLVEPSEEVQAHAGTLDIDIGLSVGVLDDDRYQEIAERLRRAGYAPVEKDSGEPIHYRWQRSGDASGVAVDFLIQDPDSNGKPGKSLHLGQEFAPIRIEALGAAFLDRIEVELEGETLEGERVRRTVQVCGPAAFVVLKAYALKVRGLPKDAYDLYYMLRNFGETGPDDVAARWRLVRDLSCARVALDILREEFSSENSIGPRRVARFLELEGDAEILADVVGFVDRFLKLVSGEAH